MGLARLYRLIEMARSREDAMWAVLDWAATQAGEFTIKDLHRVWAAAGGGGDSASYQQFSTAINNYIYKFDPQSPVAKYRNPRYKYIRVGKTDKGTVPAPLQFVTRGARGAGAHHVLRWRPGLAPMRQPAAPKAPIHAEDDPVGDALDRLERKLGRPALKAAMQRWRQLGDLHRISADIMGDEQIRGRDKMLALHVAASGLVSKGGATRADAVDAEDEMRDEVGTHTGGLFKAHEPDETGFEDDEDGKTDPEARPLGAQVGGIGPGPSGGEDLPDDLLHGDDDGSVSPPEAADSDEVAPVGSEPEEGPERESPPEEPQEDDDGPMRGTLVDEDGNRIEVTIQYDEEEGALVTDGERMYEPEDHDLEIANGVLTQEAFDALEEDGWNLVASEQGDNDGEEAQADDTAAESEEGDEDSGDNDDGGDEAEEPNDVGNPEEGEFPTYVPEPDEEGDRFERAMFELVSEGDLREDNPLWDQLRKAKDAVDAHRVIKASGLPHGLHKYALVVARAIFTNTGRDFDSGQKRNESRLASLYGIAEAPLVEPVDFDQESGLKRVFGWVGRSG